MTDHHLSFRPGSALLILLHHDRYAGIGAITGFLGFAGIANWRLPRLTGGLQRCACRVFVRQAS